MSAVWKKILTEADAQRDLIAGAGLSGGTNNNVLIGSDSDVTIAVDINGATDLGSSVASGDLLLVADVDDSNNIKKTTVGDAIAAVSSGVTSVQLTGDSGNTGADNGTVNHTIAGGNGIITSVSGDTLTVTLDITDASLSTLSSVAQDDMIAVSDESATDDVTKAISFSDFEDTIFGNVSGDATIAAGGALTIAAGSVENGMLAGSIANAKLANSTISGVSLGSNLNSLSAAANGGITLSSFNGSAAVSDLALDIDGMTDIGAALVDADLMIVDDGAGGTNRKATMSRLKTYMQNGLTFTTNTDVNVSKANLTTVLASYTGSDTLNIGDADDDTTVVIRGNLQVDGTTTTINSTSLTVDDKIILCADGSASEANTGTGGLEIEVGNATQNPFVGFVDGAALTQMVVKAAGATTSFPIAVMEFSSDSTAPTGNAGGVGSFHFDTGDDKLYVRTA